MEFLVLAAFLGLITGFIAQAKGHSFALWWFFGMAMFIVALPCSFFLKDKSGRKCPACAEYVSAEAKICKHCRSEL